MIMIMVIMIMVIMIMVMIMIRWAVDRPRGGVDQAEGFPDDPSQLGGEEGARDMEWSWDCHRQGLNYITSNKALSITLPGSSD